MPTSTLTVPESWDEITPKWMTDVLAPHHPGVEVATVTVQMRDDGTNRRARLGVEYRQGAGPATVFAKSADPEHVFLHKLTSGLFHEPRLFASGMTLPVQCPRAYASLIDVDNDNYCLVMEDMAARGADMRDATRPLTVDQAASGLRSLARLHSQFWGGRLHRPELEWLEPFEPWDGMEIAPIDSAFARLGDDAPQRVTSLTIGQLIDDVWKPYIRSLTTTPQTLLHGDAHIGNTYVLPDGEIGLLDWQVVRRGNWSVDVGYFLQGALTTADRRGSERELLAEYRGALDLDDDEKPTAEEVLTGYRASVAHGLTLWLCTASAGELWQRPDIAIALAQRYSAAYADLDTPQAIAALAA